MEKHLKDAQKRARITAALVWLHEDRAKVWAEARHQREMVEKIEAELAAVRSEKQAREEGRFDDLTEFQDDNGDDDGDEDGNDDDDDAGCNERQETMVDGRGKETAGTMEPVVACSPQTRSPVTFASLLPEVREECKAGVSLAELVAAVEEANGCKPHHSLDLSRKIMEDLLVGTGTTGLSSRRCFLAGTTERQFHRPPDLGSRNAAETIVGTEERWF